MQCWTKGKSLERKSGKSKVREEQKGTGKEEGGKPDPEAGQAAPRLPPAGKCLRPWMQQELLQEFGERAPSPGPASNFAMSPASRVLVYLGLCLSICRAKASGCRKALFLPKVSLSHQAVSGGGRHSQHTPPPPRGAHSTWICRLLLRGRGSVFLHKIP